MNQEDLRALESQTETLPRSALEESRHVVSASRDVVEPARAAQSHARAMATNERSGLEHLVTELSARFTGLPVEQIDGEIERGLRLLVEFLDTDRSIAVRVFGRRHELHARRRLGSARATRRMLTQDVQAEPALVPREGRAGRDPAASSASRTTCRTRRCTRRKIVRRTGLKSNLTIPIAVGGRHCPGAHHRRHPRVSRVAGRGRAARAAGGTDPRQWPPSQARGVGAAGRRRRARAG